MINRDDITFSSNQTNVSIPDTKSKVDFFCYTRKDNKSTTSRTTTYSTGEYVYHEICHIFTIIDKDEEVIGNWQDKCPTSLDSLKPLSFEDIYKTKMQKNSFPKVFLVAAKKSKGNTLEKTDTKEEEKVIGNMRLGYKEGSDSTNNEKVIFNYFLSADKKPQYKLWCNKDALNGVKK